MEKQSFSRRKTIILLCILAVFAILLGMWLQANGRHANEPVTLINGTVLTPAKKLSPFKLINDSNKSFTNDRLVGHWSLMFFGFTNCPMLCPTTLAKLNDAYKLLQDKDALSLPKVIFVSIDPKRDTPAKIRQYLNSFNTHFTGVTGNAGNIKKFTHEIGIAYMKAVKSGEEHNYDIDHSGVILVFNPQGQWTALLRQPLTAKNIADDFMKIQQSY